MKTLAIRSLALFLPLFGTIAAWLWRMPGRRTAGAVILATLWTWPSLLVVQMLARSLGWWSFNFDGGDLFGMPGDLFLGWSLLWGAIPALLLLRCSLVVTVSLLIGADAILMPLCQPVLQLSPGWPAGELVAAALVLIPAQLLARWTDRDENLQARALLQCVLFSGIVIFMLPSLVLRLTAGLWWSLTTLLMPEWRILLQGAIVATILGMSALQEFVVRGAGTPFPYDPPKRLVRSGVYAYVQNPMQLCTSLLFVIMAIAARSMWLAIAAIVSVAYAEGFARWDEGRDLTERFGDAAARYARAVRRWLPSWSPYVEEPSTIYFAMGCDPCSDVAAWLQSRKPQGLLFVPAETHPTLDLERVRYESPDGTFDEGVAAIARALEHINLFWAFLGFSARLPLFRQMLQLIVDGVGGGKRRVKRVVSC
jgi:protein-S-isoprenylcysteine O-methyltransferase Ste14